MVGGGSAVLVDFCTAPFTQPCRPAWFKESYRSSQGSVPVLLRGVALRPCDIYGRIGISHRAGGGNV